jgi:hypothetical protein
MKYYTITHKMLREAHACKEEYATFRKTFPLGMRVTIGNLAKCRKLNLSIEWGARNLLSAPALAEYEKVCAPALAEYKKVRNTAWAEYEKVCDTALVKAFASMVPMQGK